MGKRLLLFLLCISMQTKAQTSEIQKVVDDFFVAFHSKDTTKLRAYCSEKMILQSINENPKGNKFVNQTLQEFFNSLAKIPHTTGFEEKILSYNIQVDGAMANAWMPYEFYMNGKLQHTGVNSFQLYKDEGYWQIIYIIDTRRKKV
jgi:ketosteroid isomerase-like protein